MCIPAVEKGLPMLVLTRKSKQKIKIGDKVVITILEVQGSQVSIGIEAPREMRILRAELAPNEISEGPTTPDAAPNLIIDLTT